MKRLSVLLFACVCALLVACPNPGSAPKPVAAASSDPTESGQPQPKLPTLKLWLGAHEVATEIARTPTEHQVGMMWRTNLAMAKKVIPARPGTTM